MVGRRKLVESVQYVTLSPLPLREFLLTPSTVDEIPTILPEQQVRLTLNIDLSQELWRLVNIWDFLRRMMRTECHASRTTTHGDRGIMSLYIQTSGIICYHYLSLGHTQHTIDLLTWHPVAGRRGGAPLAGRGRCWGPVVVLILHSVHPIVTQLMVLIVTNMAVRIIRELSVVRNVVNRLTIRSNVLNLSYCLCSGGHL